MSIRQKGSATSALSPASQPAPPLDDPNALSPPRAPRWVRLLILLGLLLLALAAIWWIDRGVMLTNTHG